MFKRKPHYSLDEVHRYVEDIEKLRRWRDQTSDITEVKRLENIVDVAQKVLERLLEQLLEQLDDK